MGLMFRRRRPLMRLAAGAATATVAYNAGKRHEQGAGREQGPDGATQEAPPPASVATAPAPSDTTTEIERLASLHTSGSLTDDEFTAAKAKLLGI